MIIYSITTALEGSIEQEWIEFMKADQIPGIMKTGLFSDFRFVRVVPTEGVDVAYNLQLRCKDMATLNEFRSTKESIFVNAEASRYQGKIASFQSVLEQLIDG